MEICMKYGVLLRELGSCFPWGWDEHHIKSVVIRQCFLQKLPEYPAPLTYWIISWQVKIWDSPIWGRMWGCTLNARLHSECDTECESKCLNVMLQVWMCHYRSKGMMVFSFSDLLEHKWVRLENLNVRLNVRLHTECEAENETDVGIWG